MASSQPSGEIRDLAITAFTAAEEFANLYHKTFDTRRQAIGKVYQDQATLVWNGNPYKGNEEIVNFFNTLPSSDHQVEAMDTQPLVASLVGLEAANSTIMITFYGKVKFKEVPTKVFNQTVLLAALDNKWKIVSDNYRFAE